MSTPNPLAPQGSLLEKHGRGRSTFQIISFIGAIHVVALCGLLWIGCKKDDPSGGGLAANNPDAQGLGAGTGTGGLPPETGLPPIGAAPTNALGSAATGLPAASNSYYGGPITGAPVTTSAPPTTPNLGAGAAQPVVPADPLLGAGAGAGAGTTGAAVAGAPSDYKVQKGDIGTTIAKKFGVTVAALQAANPSVNWNRLKVDQVIAIPAKAAPAETGVGAVAGAAAGAGTAPATVEGGTSYTVRPGDTGSKIAKKFGVSWKAIRAANNLSSDSIRPNQKLTIPAKGAAAPAPSTGAGAAIPPPSSGPVATPLPTATGQ